MNSARTTLLGSPYRPSYVDVPDSYLRQARRRAPEALAEAGRRALQFASAGLVFVGGLLYQETRTPGWGGGRPRPEDISACLPDITEKPGLTLIDPRHPIGEIDFALDRMGYDARLADIRIAEPSLLPPTTEEDALALFGVYLHGTLTNAQIEILNRSFLADALAAVNGIETLVRDGRPLAPGYAAIERVAAWSDYRNPDTNSIESIMESIVTKAAKAAGDFLEIRRLFPPPSRNRAR